MWCFSDLTGSGMVISYYNGSPRSFSRMRPSCSTEIEVTGVNNCTRSSSIP